ncbi:hypothetical protein [Marinicellulosiphila megalodicopiae]|uniref:hypothetical protein n=1 Tax=Marinicellulosiphila megalodicopiae TaxID=2724896 RepID=UPI003BAE7573
MKYTPLLSLFLLPSLSFSATEPANFQNITSNNYQSALSTVNQSFGAWADASQSLDITSIWFNPAMMTYQGQQSSINLLNQPSGSVFFKAYGENVGVHLGRTSQYTSDLDIDNEVDSFDLFWSKGDKGDSIGVNIYFSIDSDTQLARETFDNVDLPAGSSYTDDNNKITIDHNKKGSTEYDFGANIGFDKGLKQYILNIEISDSSGEYDKFKAELIQTLGNDEDITKESTLGTGIKDFRFNLGGSYLEKLKEDLYLIGSAKYVFTNNSDTQKREFENESEHIILDQTNQIGLHQLNLTAGAQLSIKPSPRIEYNLQQLFNLGLGLGYDRIQVNRDFDTGTEEPTGLETYSQITRLSIDAPVMVSMKMRASKKLNMTASVQTNTISFTSEKLKESFMTVADNKYEKVDGGEHTISNNSFNTTTSNTSVAWGFGYQYSNQLVFDFNLSSAFLTDGITDSSIVNELTITYQF